MMDGDRMKKISVIFFGLLFTGCSGFGEYMSDTFWPMGSAESPLGVGGNYHRVREGSTVPDGRAALVTQPGDIWPGRVEPVPSIQEVSNSNSHFNRSFRHTLQTLDSDLERIQLKENESLSIGEDAKTEMGVHRASSAVVPGALPRQISDPAHRYIEGPNRDTVYISNGDGTTTLVLPDGSVRIVRGNPQAVATSQRERKIASDNIVMMPQKPQEISPKTKHKVKETTELLNEEELRRAQNDAGILDRVAPLPAPAEKSSHKVHGKKKKHHRHHRKHKVRHHKAKNTQNSHGNEKKND